MKKKNKLLIGAVALLGAVVTLFLIKKNSTAFESKPPKGAPQLDLENPGSQDDCPIPPIESEIG